MGRRGCAVNSEQSGEFAQGEFISPEHLRKRVPTKLILWAEEASELGLIDQIGGLSDALECLYQMIGERRAAGEK